MGATVLLVDDEPNILSSLSRLLGGYPDLSILTATSAGEARETFRVTGVDVVVSDQVLGGQDGTELLAWVRREHPEAVRILITGHTDMDIISKAIKQGRIDRLITKPWDDRELKLEILGAAEEAFRRRQRIGMHAWIERSHERLMQEQARDPRQPAAPGPRWGDEAGLAFCLAIMGIADARLAEHSRNVAETARAFARHLHMSETAQHQMHRAGLIHDVGTLRAAGEPGGEHTAEGAALAQLLPELDREAAWIRHHHERYDGGGYPDGLSETAIPIGARILSVVDAWEDLCSETDATLDSAVTRLALGAGSRFDPRIVEEFSSFVREFSLPPGERTA